MIPTFVSIVVGALLLLWAASLIVLIWLWIQDERIEHRNIPQPPQGALRPARPTYIVEGFDVRSRTDTDMAYLAEQELEIVERRLR